MGIKKEVSRSEKAQVHQQLWHERGRQLNVVHDHMQQVQGSLLGDVLLEEAQVH